MTGPWVFGWWAHSLEPPPRAGAFPHCSLAAISAHASPRASLPWPWLQTAPSVPTTSTKEQDQTGCLSCLWAAEGTWDARSISGGEPAALTQTQLHGPARPSPGHRSASCWPSLLEEMLQDPMSSLVINEIRMRAPCLPGAHHPCGQTTAQCLQPMGPTPHAQRTRCQIRLGGQVSLSFTDHW